MALSMVLTIAIGLAAQAKKPTLMVLPSDLWCNQNGYTQQYDDQGTTRIMPDYKAALQNSMDLKLAIAKINDLMAERGFPLKDVEQQMKMVEQQQAELNLTMSKNGNEIAETPLDRLFRTAKADIIIELSWSISQTGPKKTLTYILEAKDSYTGKSIGGANGSSAPSFSAEVPVLLEEAVVANIDNFNNRLQAHFDDLFDNGREVALEIRVFDNNEAGIDLETEFPGGNELADVIDEWMEQNTVKGRFSKLGSSENYVIYEQVRIPLFKPNGAAMDTEAFAKNLRNVLRKTPYNIPVKIMNRGLGRAVLILGEK